MIRVFWPKKRATITNERRQVGSRSMAPTEQIKRRWPRHRLRYWLVLALVIHAEVILVVLFATFFWAPRNADLVALGQGKPSPEAIDINTIDEETSRKILAELEKEREKQEAEELKKEQEAKQAPGQVVDIAKPREEKRPDNARFAAEHDSSVEKETKKYGRFDQRARQGDSTGDATQSRPATSASQATAPSAGSSNPGALAMRRPAARAAAPTSGPPGPPAPPVLAQPGEVVEAPAEQGGELAQPGRLASPPPGGAPSAGAPPAPSSPSNPALAPSPQQLARAIGSGTQDHLKDIDDGEQTALNAKKWKFASFFNRVKQQVREHWRPAEQYRRRDPTGAIYGQKDRYTLLRVQLTPEGKLANVALEMPSGIEFLDDEAIEAFKLAQPFPNPPKQLVEEGSGTISFRFGFFFELAGAPKMKIFRYNSM